MAMNSSATTQSSAGVLTFIFTVVQNGVTALNSATKAISLIFPSS